MQPISLSEAANSSGTVKSGQEVSEGHANLSNEKRMLGDGTHIFRDYEFGQFVSSPN